MLGCYYCSWVRQLFQTLTFPDSKLSPASTTDIFTWKTTGNSYLSVNLSLFLYGFIFLSHSLPLDIKSLFVNIFRSTLDDVIKLKVWNGALITISSKPTMCASHFHSPLNLSAFIHYVPALLHLADLIFKMSCLIETLKKDWSRIGRNITK